MNVTLKTWGQRALLLGLILLSYAHVVVQLDAKAFWWDESLSLQRAEQPLLDILRGVLWIRDGFSSLLTIDQHPFFSFLLQGALIRTAGESEFVVRYAAVMGATLLVPSLWVLARWLLRRDVAPPAAPWLAVLLGAISPFMLWYGQEARPYALWAALAVLTTYLALRATEDRELDGRFAIGFVVAEAIFLTTHYYAVLLLPVHALILFAWLARRNFLRALIAAAVLLVVGSLVGAYGAYTIFAQGGGQNFASISLAMLVPDLLNAFSLGLSVDLAQRLVDRLGVWRTGAGRGRVGPAFAPGDRRGRLGAAGLLRDSDRHPACAQRVSPAVHERAPPQPAGRSLYPAQRRGPGSALALAALGRRAADARTRGGDRLQHGQLLHARRVCQGRLQDLWQLPVYPHHARRRRALLPAILLAHLRVLRTTHNRRRWHSCTNRRGIRRRIGADEQADKPIGIYGIPLLGRSMDDTEDWLRTLGEKYDRVWVLKSGTHPYFDEEWHLEKWLPDNMLRVRNAKFFSHSSLHAFLFLPKIPVFEQLPADVQHPLTAEYGNLVRLAGYSLDPVADESCRRRCASTGRWWRSRSAVTSTSCSWWSRRPTGARRYCRRSNASRMRATSPPSTGIRARRSSNMWSFRLPLQPPAASSQRYVTFQMYDAETLEKLPVTKAADGAVQIDNTTVRLP